LGFGVLVGAFVVAVHFWEVEELLVEHRLIGAQKIHYLDQLVILGHCYSILLLGHTQGLFRWALRVTSSPCKEHALECKILVGVALALELLIIILLKKHHDFMEDATKAPDVCLLVII
jgi:hypothetical protein